MRTRSAMLTAAVLSAGLLVLSACGTGAETGDKAERGTGSARKPAAPVSVRIADSEYGRVLVDQSGRTLYAFTRDKAGESNCAGDCIAAWPALTSGSAAKAGEGANRSLLGGTERTKGVTQVVYNEWPLYYYAGDAVAGDVNGQGVDDEWFLLSADGKLVKKQLG